MKNVFLTSDSIGGTENENVFEWLTMHSCLFYIYVTDCAWEIYQFTHVSLPPEALQNICIGLKQYIFPAVLIWIQKLDQYSKCESVRPFVLYNIASVDILCLHFSY